MGPLVAVSLHPLLVGPGYRPRSAGDEIPPPTYRWLFEAARWSSSAWNRQPWRFVIGRRGDDTFDILCASLAATNRTRLGDARALILAAVRVRDSAGTPIGDTDYELGLAVGRLTLQARASGIDVNQFGGFERGAVRAALRVPADYALVAVLGVGFPTATPRRGDESRRLSLRDLVYSGRWGVPADLDALDSDPAC